MSTLSANLTLDGLLFNLAFFAADKSADFRVEDWKKREEKNKWMKNLGQCGHSYALGGGERERDIINYRQTNRQKDNQTTVSPSP